ncbi:cytochrome c [Vreelandella aquamarina]|uniref:c-type cytochrome n=1 Tax=Vreelandella aquamarina TaxID=77097 RepID=UPI00384AE70F
MRSLCILPGHISLFACTAVAAALLLGTVSSQASENDPWASPPSSAESTSFADQREAVIWRQDTFDESKSLLRQLRFDIVNQRDLSAAEPRIDSLRQMLSADNMLPAFIEGSHGSGSDARPEIWEEWDRYRSGFDQLDTDIATLQEAVSNDDLRAAAKGLSVVGESCKSCHRGYRY